MSRVSHDRSSIGHISAKHTTLAQRAGPEPHDRSVLGVSNRQHEHLASTIQGRKKRRITHNDGWVVAPPLPNRTPALPAGSKRARAPSPASASARLPALAGAASKHRPSNRRARLPFAPRRRSPRAQDRRQPRATAAASALATSGGSTTPRKPAPRGHASPRPPPAAIASGCEAAAGPSNWRSVGKRCGRAVRASICGGGMAFPAPRRTDAPPHPSVRPPEQLCTVRKRAGKVKPIPRCGVVAHIMLFASNPRLQHYIWGSRPQGGGADTLAACHGHHCAPPVAYGLRCHNFDQHRG